MTAPCAILPDVRPQFPCLDQTVHGKRLTYLDSAATALKPTCVIDAVSEHYARESANIHRGVHALSEQATASFENARESVRTHLNAAHAHEIIFTSGTTASINLVAHSFGQLEIGPGDEILISEMEHHSNIVPWQLLRERCGAVLRVAPMNDSGDIDRDAFRAALNDRTRLVAITALSNALGTVNPVAELIKEAHTAGASVLLDAAQALPLQPMDVQALDCDFLAFSGHKLFGPTGIGVLYGKQTLLDAMPPFLGGGDMIVSVTFDQTTYNDLPYKFEAGTPHIAGAIGLGRALTFIRELGYPAIQAHETALLHDALAALQAIDGVHLIGTPAQRRGIISFLVDQIHPHDLGTILDQEGIAIRAGHHCAQPVMAHYKLAATARASFSIYNNQEDIDHLVAGIRRAQEIFK
ncbi:MAG: SufS family cysteine desulfurase [Lentisphaerae bacterium]|nr:SufS family cysteine desulfurase [Lentisphaerota bacterium]